MAININEQLLDAWLRLSTMISNDRLVSAMPFNESLICNILYRNQIHNPEHCLTATDLCNETKMLKSQMNRTLTSMEKKDLIIRERCASDKRRWLIHLNMEHIELYEKQHRQILSLIDALIAKFGESKAPEIIKLFHIVANTAEEIIYHG